MIAQSMPLTPAAPVATVADKASAATQGWRDRLADALRSLWSTTARERPVVGDAMLSDYLRRDIGLGVTRSGPQSELLDLHRLSA